MARKYYCLISGLAEYTLESDHKGFDAVALRNEIAESLSAKDRERLRLFYLFYDIENIIHVLNGKNTYNVLGYYTPEELAEECKNPVTLPKPIARVIALHTGTNKELTETDSGDEDTAPANVEAALWEAYYGLCTKSSCSFIREWYGFDNTLRNICAAFTARSKSMPIAEQLVGHNEVTEALSHSSASDFGLRNEIEYIEQIVSLLEMKNIIEKEHRLDLIRWNKADELTTFDYFDINNILAYLVKVNIIHRWVALDRKRGEEMLRTLIRELSDREILDRAEKQETKE